MFCTKGRQPYLRDLALREELFAYLVGTCHGNGCSSLRTGGWEDHVHVLCRLGRTVSVAELIKILKTSSSTWIKDKATQLHDFHWQAGYGAFSVSPAHVDALVDYIRNQEQHHHTETFQDEFRRICAKYGLEIDERYVWD